MSCVLSGLAEALPGFPRRAVGLAGKARADLFVALRVVLDQLAERERGFGGPGAGGGWTASWMRCAADDAVLQVAQQILQRHHAFDQPLGGLPYAGSKNSAV